jgi:hypothetical protein
VFWLKENLVLNLYSPVEHKIEMKVLLIKLRALDIYAGKWLS